MIPIEVAMFLVVVGITTACLTQREVHTSGAGKELLACSSYNY